MTEIRELFLAALDQPVDSREEWLENQCGGKTEAFHEVISLLGSHELSNDPLEKRFDEALSDLSEEFGQPTGAAVETSKSFLSKLLEVGVMSRKDIEGLSEAIAAGRSSSEPRELATSLVAEGKLTRFQAAALLKGQPEILVDKYLIIDLIDSGGMGVVFKALHRPMNRIVAIKILPPTLINSKEKLTRFQREVRVAATLSHPNIVVAFDADESRGTHFLVMEYVSGRNLHQAIQEDGPFSVTHAVEVTIKSAEALEYAHGKDIIHRDIKPRNIMLTKAGDVKVLDMGLARFYQRNVPGGDMAASLASHAAPTVTAQNEGTQMTQIGDVLGTVSFMGPEQAVNAKAVDPRTDVYSLGCTLFFLLTGRPPYIGETAFQTLEMHKSSEIPSLRSIRSDVGAVLDSVVQKMLAKNPDDRFASMQGVIESLRKAETTGEQTHAKSDTNQPPFEEHSRSDAVTQLKEPMSKRERDQSSRSKPAALVAIGALLVLAFWGFGPLNPGGTSSSTAAQSGEAMTQTTSSPQERDPNTQPSDDEGNEVVDQEKPDAERIDQALPAPPAGPWTELFNGKDLVGWTQNKQRLWPIANGAFENPSIVRNSLLSSNETYRDFELLIEYQSSDTSISVVHLNLRSGENPVDVVLAGTKTGKGGLSGAISRLTKPITTGSGEMPPDNEWTTLLVRVLDDQIQTWLNDRFVASYTLDQNSRGEGQIAIKGYGAKNASMKYRRVAVRRLPENEPSEQPSEKKTVPQATAQESVQQSAPTTEKPTSAAPKKTSQNEKATNAT